MHQIIQNLSDWYNHALQTGGYPAIVLMMAVESSLFPLPSELVIPPAAHWAHKGQIPLSLWGIVLAGTIGAGVCSAGMFWGLGAVCRPFPMGLAGHAFFPPEKKEGGDRRRVQS